MKAYSDDCENADTDRNIATALLDGVTVLEFADDVASATCARILADLGASVTRYTVPHLANGAAFANGSEEFYAALWTHANRGKVTRDRDPLLGTDEYASIAQSDILVLDRSTWLTLAADPAAEVSSSAVVVVVSPFGIDGERAHWLGDDLVTQAYGGGCLRNGEVGREPLGAPRFVGDYETGLGAAGAALIGLFDARRSGMGYLIDVASADSWATLQTGNSLLEFIFQGRMEHRGGQRYVGRGYPHTILRTADGFARLICVQGKEWARALAMMDSPAWGVLDRYRDRVRNQESFADELDELVEEWLMQRTGDELLTSALQYRVPWAPVRRSEAVLAEPQLSARRYVDSYGRVGYPVRFSRDAVPASADNLPVANTLRIPVSAVGKERGDGWAPLAGLRVLDFGWAWAGGLVGGILADYGAEVIKVEARGRLDPMRLDRPLVGVDRDIDQGSLNHNVNRGKKSVEIDISTTWGAATARELASKVDVLVENLSPGVLVRHGLGYDDLFENNPGLIYLSLSGTGASGPLAPIRAYAPVLHALSGMDTIVGYPGERFLGLQHSFADPNAALHGVVSILAALIERERSGLGQWLDLSQLEAMIDSIVPYIVAASDLTTPIGNRSPLGGVSGVFRSKGEDEWVAVSCIDPSQCAAVAHLTGVTLGDNSKSWSQQEFDAVENSLRAWIRTRPRDTVAEELQSLGIPAAPLLNIGDRFADSHFHSRHCFTEASHPVVGAEILTAPPWQFVGCPRSVRSAAPLLGEHTAEILGSLLGFDAEQLEALEITKAAGGTG